MDGSFPFKYSITTTPCALAVCANCIPLIRSPIAYTPGMLVLKCSSTTILPLSISGTASSANNPSVFGIRPTAQRTYWADASHSFSFSVYLQTYAPSLSSTDCTPADVCTSIPLFFSSILRLCEISLSIFGTSLGIASRIVTLHPSAENAVANSTLITPPPIITRLSGISSSLNNSSLDNTPLRSIPESGSINGLLPAARIIFLASSTCISSPSTCTL